MDGFTTTTVTATEPIKLDYKTLAALPSSGLPKGNRTPSADFTTGSKRDSPSSPSPSVPQQASINFLSQSDSRPGPLKSPDPRPFLCDSGAAERENRPPKRVSLVGEDDLRKMKEEEARKIQMKREQLLREEEDGTPGDSSPRTVGPSTPTSVFIEGVEYKVERVDGGSLSSLTGFSPSESQRNSLEDAFRLEQRPSSMSGLSPIYPGGTDGAAPVRTAKAERRLQERLRVQSPELTEQEMQLSPAERRALQAEKRAMWRAASSLEDSIRQYEQSLAKKLYLSRQQRPRTPEDGSRMKSLEQDALKAQVVIARSKEGRKRSTLEQLAESPSPAPTPSPTPLEDYSPRLLTSPGRLSLSDKKFDYRQFAAIPSSKPVYEIQMQHPSQNTQRIAEYQILEMPSILPYS
ncbi:unnamed protein product [Ranitomeya imitator]|uniref:Uncharacterized protein n=1 Tax=Ranitomeya imitator TaxID=111125 RepID=A0ABN9MCJ0_9NEOB|nr:unnamed protein product [Ranitomeya imitator]